MSVRYIPTTEIQQDIADTEREIRTMRQELESYELLPHGSPNYLMAQKLWIPNRRDGIRQREEFIVKLREMLAARSQAVKDAEANPTTEHEPSDK